MEKKAKEKERESRAGDSSEINMKMFRLMEVEREGKTQACAGRGLWGPRIQGVMMAPVLEEVGRAALLLPYLGRPSSPL